MTEENNSNNQQQTVPAMSPEEVISSLKGFGDIKVNVKVLLGKVHMPIGQYLKITRGSIVELGKGRNEPLEVFVNDHMVAQADVVLALDSDMVRVEVTEVHKPKKF